VLSNILRPQTGFSQEASLGAGTGTLQLASKEFNLMITFLTVSYILLLLLYKFIRAGLSLLVNNLAR